MAMTHMPTRRSPADRAAVTRRLRSARGVSLIEATIVLGVIAVLSGVAAPSVSRTLAQGRLARATSDVAAIRTAIHSFITDNSFVPFTSNGANAGGDDLEMLVSDGDIPTLSTAVSALGGNNVAWDDAVNCCAGAIDVDMLEDNLVTNVTPTGASYAIGATGWRGAYINAPVDPDPWGNRYAVNVAYLRTATTNDVFVLSAGPDEEVDTQFVFTTGGAFPGDDDIMNVVRRDAGLVVP
jgi:type II secretory pathway pseudopilin PulG